MVILTLMASSNSTRGTYSTRIILQLALDFFASQASQIENRLA